MSAKWRASATRLRPWLKALGAAVCLLSLLFFADAFGENLRTLAHLQWGTPSWASLCAAVALYLGAIAASGVCWHLLLVAVGEPSGLCLSLGIFAISQMAKYIPGNVAQHVGRVALARAHGISTPGVLVTAVLESAGVVLAGSTIALLALIANGPAYFGDPREMPSSWRIAVVASAAAAIIAVALMAFLGRRRGDPLPEQNTPPYCRLWVLATCFLAYVGVFLIYGLSIDLVARAVFGAPESQFLLVTGMFALAWIAGFITPGAPAGLGVREAVLVVTLTPLYGEPAAVGLSTALRAVSTVGDGLTFLGGLLLRRWGHPSSRRYSANRLRSLRQS